MRDGNLCRTGNKQMVVLLMKHDADQTIKDEKGLNAARAARESGFIHVASILASHNKARLIRPREKAWMN